MTEDKAIDLALKLTGKRVIPGENRDDFDTAVIQTIATLYLNGYEVVPRFMPKITLGGLKQMEQDNVIY